MADDVGEFVEDLFGLGDAGSVDPANVHTPHLPGMVTGAGEGSMTGHRIRSRETAAAAEKIAFDRAIKGRTAPIMGHTRPADVAQINRDQINLSMAQDKAAAQRQQAFAQQDLLDAARGNVASAAAIQQQKGVQAAIAAGQALANSARGGGAASIMAQRQAAQGAATTASQAVQDAALLRAQEQATARGMYVDAVGQERAQTLGRAAQEADVAKAQATFAHAVNAQDYEGRYKANKANQDAILTGRAIDDAAARYMLGVGQGYSTLEGAIAEHQADTIMANERAKAERDLKIALVNAGAETDRIGQQLGLLEAGVETGAKAFGLG